MIRAVPYFINSLAYNLKGTNASGKVMRDQNISASLFILTIFAKSVIELDYGKLIVKNYFEEVMKALKNV